MQFDYRHKNDEYRKSAPIEIGKTYQFENGKNESHQVYFSIAFISFPRVFVKYKSKSMNRFFEYVFGRMNKWLNRKVRYLSVVIESGSERSEHKVLFSGYGKYNFIYSDVLNDWVDIVSNKFSGKLGEVSIRISALDPSGKTIKPNFFYGRMFISEPLFIKPSKGKNIIFITAESLSDFDYLLKEKMISDDTYQLYKKVFGEFTSIEHGVSQGDWTFPVAFTYNTGLLPSQHKMFNSKRICAGIDKLNPNIETIAGLLKEKGYLTFSATLGRVNVEYGFAKGFDFYFKPFTDLSNFEYTGDDKWIIKKLEQFGQNCFIHAHIDRLHAPFSTTTGPWSRAKMFSTPELAEDDTLLNPESYYEKNLRYLLFELHSLISYLKFNNMFDDTIFILTGDHGTAIGEWFKICQKNSLVDSRVRIPYLINQKTDVKSKNANIRHIDDICKALGVDLPSYFKYLPQYNEELVSYGFSEAILKTRNDLYLLAIRSSEHTYFYFADVDWSNFTVKKFVEEYAVSSEDNARVEDAAILKKFNGVREKFFELNQKFYTEMHG